MKKILILLLTLPIFVGCSSDDDINFVPTTLTFKFTHNWDGETFSNGDLGLTTFENSNGDDLIIDRLRYLISNLKLNSESGVSTLLQGYQLVDVSNTGSLTFSLNISMPRGDYNYISFNFGFSDEFNTSGIHPDLNSASWNWPDNLGGGYHFLQMDGTYTTPEGQQPFNYHMGTARVNEGVFESNFIEVILSQNYSIGGNTTFEIKMNVAEWFKNPHTWNLNEYNTDLMMNYTAQKRMNDNGETVFSLGPVTTP